MLAAPLATAAVAAAAATTSYAAFRASRSLTAPVSSKDVVASVVVPAAVPRAEDEGSLPRTNPDRPDVDADALVDEVLPVLRRSATAGGKRTMFHLFAAAAEAYAAVPCHGTLDPVALKFAWKTYAQVFEDVLAIGRGLDAEGLIKPLGAEKYPHASNLRVAGLFGPNSSAWVTVEYAILSRGGTTVPLYATLNRDGIVHVLNLTQCAAVAVTHPGLALKLIDAKRDAPSLSCIVLESPASPELAAAAQAAGVRLVTLDQLRESGRRAALPPAEPTPETCHTFCFTSGSTGPPKGALLTHKAMITNVAATLFMIGERYGQGSDYYLSFLPLAHQMERLVQSTIYARAGSVGFSRGVPEKIMEDVALLRPTIWAAVPRVLNRLALGLATQFNAATGLKRALLDAALAAKLHDLRWYGHHTHPVWDRLVFGKIRAKLGLDRCNVVITGSAPIAPRVLDTLRVVLCCPVNEGYGATEGTCSVSTDTPSRCLGGPAERISHVGGPIPTYQIKLIPSGSYLPSDRTHEGVPVVGRGEVLFKGPCVMRGYYDMVDKSKAAVDEDGWYHSGDVGVWLAGTYQLSIVDRVVNLFKTSLGEYVYPDKIERALARCPLVAGAFVFGTTLNARLVAVVVLNQDAVKPFLAKRGVDQADAARANEAVCDEIKRAAKDDAGLAGYEVPGAFSLKTEPFSVEAGVLTPTFKIVRAVATRVYAEDIRRMYRELGEDVALKV